MAAQSLPLSGRGGHTLPPVRGFTKTVLHNRTVFWMHAKAAFFYDDERYTE